MSLRKAVEQIVEDMEAEAREERNLDFQLRLKVHCKMLRMALSASEGEQTQQPPPQLSPEIQHRLAIESARREFREKKLSEEGEPQMLKCRGGAFDDTYHSVQTEMPEGAFTQIGNQVYQRKGNELVYMHGREGK